MICKSSRERENEKNASHDRSTIDPIRAAICRKLCSKLDELSDRNEREGFYGDLVNQVDTRREREIEFRDSVDEFVGTVRAAEIAP